MDVTIDMEKETEIHSVGADFMQVCGPEVFMPSEVIISVSNDGKEFTELKRMEHKVVKDEMCIRDSPKVGRLPTAIIGVSGMVRNRLKVWIRKFRVL